MLSLESPTQPPPVPTVISNIIVPNNTGTNQVSKNIELEKENNTFIYILIGTVGIIILSGISYFIYKKSEKNYKL